MPKAKPTTRDAPPRALEEPPSPLPSPTREGGGPSPSPLEGEGGGAVRRDVPPFPPGGWRREITCLSFSTFGGRCRPSIGRRPLACTIVIRAFFQVQGFGQVGRSRLAVFHNIIVTQPSFYSARRSVWTAKPFPYTSLRFTSRRQTSHIIEAMCWWSRSPKVVEFIHVHFSRKRAGRAKDVYEISSLDVWCRRDRVASHVWSCVHVQ